jgi:hypothetical protein
MEPGRQFTVVTEHSVKSSPGKRRARKSHFDTYEEAKAHGDTLDPMAGGPDDTMPNISDKWQQHKGYERGLFSGPNKYGVVINNRATDY